MKRKFFKISGYAAVFEVCDSHGDILSKGAFDAITGASNIYIPILYEHNANNKIGVVTNIAQDKRGLYIDGIIDTDCCSHFIADLIDMIICGFIRGLSIGYKTIKSSYDDFSLSRHLTSVHLYEISVVGIPSNPHTIISNCSYSN